MIRILKYIASITFAVVVLITAIAFYFYPPVEIKHEYSTTHVEIGHSYKSEFTDRNPIQLPSAKRMGITPQDDASNLPQLVDEGKLVKLSSNFYYSCIASMPYLTPEAADLLAEIGRRYKKELGYVFKKPVLTSMLRTRESVDKLQKHNRNAVKNSCHLYGTTFDITYARMNTKERRAMAQVLADLRKAGYCHVLYEVNQPCFHITVRSISK